MMKKFKYLLLVFVAFLSLNMNAKAATEPALFITIKDDYVEVGKKLSDYDLEEGVLSLPVGNTLQLIAFTAHGNDIHAEDLETGWFVDEVSLKGVTWTSNNSSVATVDSNGLVKTVKEGTATIVASYAGKTKNFEIKVTSTAECAICVGCGSYNIIFITNGGNEISTMSICKTCGDSTQKVTLPTPTKKGYKFIGWYKDAEFDKPVDVSLPSKVGDYVNDGCYDSETAIYAKWEKVEQGSTTVTEEPIETIGEKQEPTVTPTETNEDKKPEKKSKVDGYKIYGLVVPAVCVVSIIILMVFLFRKKKEQ